MNASAECLFVSSTTANSPLGDEGSVGLLLSIVNQDGIPLNHAFIKYASSGGTLLVLVEIYELLIYSYVNFN
ncbi:hypothetical protein QUA81_12965 [Microcoleus sp. F6_B4]